MTVAVIINPVSGPRGRREDARRRRELAHAALAAAGLPGEVFLTTAAQHARALARDAVDRGAALVIAWGGDGTVNEVASVLAFGPAALGVVPAGSGNGLARALGVPWSPADALRVALRGAERRIDVGELGGRLFVNVAGIGLDAEVAFRFDTCARDRRGLLPYLTLGLQALLRDAGRDYTIRLDGEAIRRRALLVLCANGQQYGGGARMTPAALLDDGVLDLLVVGDRPALARLWHARRVFTGSLPAAPDVLVRQVRSFEIAADGPLRFHVDGEPVLGDVTLAGRVHPGALRVRVRPDGLEIPRQPVAHCLECKA
jgi:YegS/Rv2252/BmrU family lipid kinase